MQGAQVCFLRAQLRTVLDEPECDESGLRLGLNVFGHIRNLHALSTREDAGRRHATIDVTASGSVKRRAQPNEPARRLASRLDVDDFVLSFAGDHCIVVAAVDVNL